MSGKIMGSVYDLDLSHVDQAVLMAMADHAEHDGTKVFPSVEYVAWKTSYSERTVQRSISRLRKAKILKLVRKARHHLPNEYRIDIAAGPRKAPFDPENRGDTVTPLQATEEVPPTYRGDTPDQEGRQDGSSGVTQGVARGDTAQSPKPSSEPSVEPSEEPSVKPARPKKDEYNRLRKFAEDLFIELTGLATPTDKRRANQRWWRPLLTICDEAEWDETRIDLLMRATFLRMQNLTYDAPDQWVKTLRAIKGEIARGAYRPPGTTQALSILRDYYRESKERQHANQRK